MLIGILAVFGAMYVSSSAGSGLGFYFAAACAWVIALTFLLSGIRDTIVGGFTRVSISDTQFVWQYPKGHSDSFNLDEIRAVHAKQTTMFADQLVTFYELETTENWFRLPYVDGIDQKKIALDLQRRGVPLVEAD